MFITSSSDRNDNNNNSLLIGKKKKIHKLHICDAFDHEMSTP